MILNQHTGLVLAPTATKEIQRRLTDATAYHLRAEKFVRPADELAIAAANQPFGQLLAEVEPLSDDPAELQTGLQHLAEAFLRRNWPMLEPSILGSSVNVSFSLTDNDIEEEATRFQAYIARNERLGLNAQASGELPSLYRNFVETREILRALRQHNLLQPHMVIADKHLPWFLITAPVWYVQSGRNRQMTYGEGNDPYPDDFVQFMAQRLGTQRLADWYQLWNRRSRPFNTYQGDCIPGQVLDVLEIAGEFLDYLVIATPYHDVASQEWADPAWQRLIDPYLLGFSRKLPGLFFVLGRWSNTGVFPFSREMTAATMAYLKSHVEKIQGFGHPYWHCLNDRRRAATRSAQLLQEMAMETLSQYQAGNLFDWLTEGRPDPELIAAQ